jgi:lysophospholipase L1-like esterase
MLIRLLPLIALAAVTHAQDRPEITLSGDWQVTVRLPGQAPRTFAVAPPPLVTITAEPHHSLPLFNPKAGGWVKGDKLLGVKAMEASTPHLLDPASLVLRSSPSPDSRAYIRGADYDADLDWGTIGRVPGGAIDPSRTVYAFYRHALLRLDSVVLTGAGRAVLRKGEPKAAAPLPPPLEPGERLLANIYVTGRIPRLAADHLFPVLESAYPTAALLAPHPSVARLIGRLEAGEPVRLLAWGDSVTDGRDLPNAKERWQEQFVARLRARYRKARIELLTQAWGGRNTGSYLAEPPGSPHNYKETVLGVKPDWVISEFVNDARLSPAEVEERYSRILADFRQIGAEWSILTPHYIRPDWMGLSRERDIDDDPRPHVAGLRQFVARHPEAALADASLRYGRLWRQGIPYSTLMLNAINHPDARGMRLFADALMALFP